MLDFEPESNNRRWFILSPFAGLRHDRVSSPHNYPSPPPSPGLVSDKALIRELKKVSANLLVASGGTSLHNEQDRSEKYNDKSPKDAITSFCNVTRRFIGMVNSSFDNFR